MIVWRWNNLNLFTLVSTIWNLAAEKINNNIEKSLFLFSCHAVGYVAYSDLELILQQWFFLDAGTPWTNGRPVVRPAVKQFALWALGCTCCPAVPWMPHIHSLWFIHNSKRVTPFSFLFHFFLEEHLDCLIIYLSYAQTFLLPHYPPFLSFPCAPVPHRACSFLSPSPPQTHKIPALDIITWINAWTMALGREWNERNRAKGKD